MKTLGAAVSISIVLLFLQLEVATLISTPHIRSMANQIIRFNTTNNVSENSVSGVLAHMCFFLCLWLFIREGSGTPLQYSCLGDPMDGGAWWAAVYGITQSRTWLSNFTFTFHFHTLEKEMATHSSVLAWRIPGTGEPGGLLSMGSHRVGHDWSDLAAAAAWLFIGLSYLNANSWVSALCVASFIHYCFLQISDEQLQVCESKLEAKDKDVGKTGLHSSKENHP